jgi:hypothetical protein
MISGAGGKAGELVVDYFADHLKKGGTTNVSQADIQSLQGEFKQNGLTDCDLRRALEAIYAQSPSYPGGVTQPGYNRPPAVSSKCHTSSGECPILGDFSDGAICFCSDSRGNVYPGFAL